MRSSIGKKTLQIGRYADPRQEATTYLARRNAKPRIAKLAQTVAIGDLMAFDSHCPEPAAGPISWQWRSSSSVPEFGNVETAFKLHWAVAKRNRFSIEKDVSAPRQTTMRT